MKVKIEMVVEGKTPDGNADLQEMVDQIRSGAFQRDLMRDGKIKVTMVTQILKK